MTAPSSDRRNAAFTLVEVSIALAIAAVALISLTGFLSRALQDASDSADQTAVGSIFQDIHDRIEGSPLKEGPLPASPLYYDQRGVFHEPAPDEPADGDVLTDRFFRADVSLVRPADAADGDLFAVRVDVYWPIGDDGTPLRPEEPGASITYYTTARTGRAWPIIDPDHIPKIEY